MPDFPASAPDNDLPQVDQDFSPYASITDDPNILTRTDKTSQFLKWAVPSVIAGFADTFGTSVGLLDDGELVEGLKGSFGEFGDFYERNAEGARTVGDLTGMFIPGLGAVKAFRAGSIVQRQISGKGRLLNSVFASGKSYDSLLRKTRARDLYLAKQATGNFADDTVRQGLVRNALRTRLADTVKETVAFELGVFATMNTSDVLYPDEFSTAEIIALNALFPSVAAVGESMYLKRLIRASAARPELADIAKNFREPLEAPLDIVVSRPGQRDLLFATTAIARVQTKDASALAADTIKGSALNSASQTYRQEMQNEAVKFIKDSPISGYTKSENLGPKSPEVRTIVSSGDIDPTAMLGTFSAQRLELDKFPLDEAALKKPPIQQRKRKIDGIRKQFADDVGGISPEKADEITALQKEVDAIEASQSLVLEVDGSLSIASRRKSMYQDKRKKIDRQRPTLETADFSSSVLKTDPPKGRSRTIALTEDGILRLPGKSAAAGTVDRFRELSFYDTTAVYGVMQDAVSKYKPGTGQITLSNNDHFTRLDYAAELHDRFKGNAAIMGDLKFPTGIENIDQLRFLSLSKKYDDYVHQRKRIEFLIPNRIVPEASKTNFEDLAVMLNLPKTSTGEPHPIVKVFENIYQQGDETFDAARLFDVNQFKRLAQEDTFYPELTGFMNKDLELAGNMLHLDPENAPVFLLKRPVDIRQYNRDFLVNQAAQQRAFLLSEFETARQHGANLVATVNDYLKSNPEFVAQAQKTERLIEGTQKGSGLIGTQQRARGEVATIQAAQALEENLSKAFRNESAKLLAPHSPTFTKLRAPQHQTDLVEFSMFANARRQGWDVEADAFIDAEGRASFTLSKTKANRDRWELMYKESLPDDAMMPAPTRMSQGKRQYKPLTLSPLALKAAEGFRDTGLAVLQNTNHLKKIYGRGATKMKNWWVPPKNMSKEETVFIVDPATERTLNVVSGSDRAEAIRIAQREIKERDEKGIIYVTQEDMGKYFTLRDDAFERMSDFSDPLNQTGPSKGKAVNIATIEEGPKVLNDMVDTIERSSESIMRRSVAAYFEPQLKQAKRMFNSNSPKSGAKGQSIWQQYPAALLGQPTLNPNDVVGAVYFGAEKAFDDVLETVWHKMFPNTAGEAVQATRNDAARYNKLRQQLGDHTPFEDAQDYAERVLRVKTPPKTKQIFAGLNKLTAALTLRIFEVGHSVLTLTSLGATMPGVVKALTRHPAENAEDYAARIGAFGLQVADDTAMFHPTRAITSAMHFMFTPEGRKVWKDAADKGYLDQNVSEIFKTLTAPKEGYAENLMRRAVDMTSVLSDKSERLARGISFVTGYNIAKRGLGIERAEAAYAFAHRFANETIGNYAPNNRPRIFQGAAGMPLGLFMTFMWNYYERIFSYIGNKQTRALATQFATQAAVFGGQTVPGFQQFSDLFASNYDGTTNIVDGMQNTFGTEVTEVVMYGAISNLPKLFGADDGIALSTRGDVNVRNIPTLFTFQDTPVYAMIRDGVNALRKGFEQVRTRGGLDLQQSAEIMQNYSTSRFLRNLGYLTTGVVTDRRGQPVGERDTITEILQGEAENSLGLIASIAGLRTIDENRRTQNAYKIRSGEISRAARIRQLRDRVRADTRAGLTDTDVSEAMESYVKHGGTPEYFPRWLMEQQQSATMNKDMKKLLDIMNSPTRGKDIRRLMTTIGPGFDGDPDY